MCHLALVEPTPWLKVGDDDSTEVGIEDVPDDAVGLDWPPMPLAGTVTELGPDGKIRSPWMASIRPPRNGCLLSSSTFSRGTTSPTRCCLVNRAACSS